MQARAIRGAATRLLLLNMARCGLTTLLRALLSPLSPSSSTGMPADLPDDSRPARIALELFAALYSAMHVRLLAGVGVGLVRRRHCAPPLPPPLLLPSSLSSLAPTTPASADLHLPRSAAMPVFAVGR